MGKPCMLKLKMIITYQITDFAKIDWLVENDSDILIVLPR